MNARIDITSPNVAFILDFVSQALEKNRKLKKWSLIRHEFLDMQQLSP